MEIKEIIEFLIREKVRLENQAEDSLAEYRKTDNMGHFIEGQRKMKQVKSLEEAIHHLKQVI